MYRKVIEEANKKMEKTIGSLEHDFNNVRTGRANPKILDDIKVDYYGTETPLNQMANISVPEPRLIQISVWDVKAIPMIEKAILTSDLGLNPGNDGKVIRLLIPDLNEERRKELTKVVKKEAETAKVAIRSIRHEYMDKFKKMEKKNEITEDDHKDANDKFQKEIDKYIKIIDDMCKVKEEEIMKV